MNDGVYVYTSAGWSSGQLLAKNAEGPGSNPGRKQVGQPPSCELVQLRLEIQMEHKDLFSREGQYIREIFPAYNGESDRLEQRADRTHRATSSVLV